MEIEKELLERVIQGKKKLGKNVNQSVETESEPAMSWAIQITATSEIMTQKVVRTVKWSKDGPASNRAENTNASPIVETESEPAMR